MSGVVATAFGSRFQGAPNYAPTASLTTPTYDASGVTTEPTWIRKPSWVSATGTDLLAHNPLTGGSAAVENPSILISADNGSTWATPSGVTNPIAGPPASGNYADCHLFADPNTNQLVMTWTAQSNATANQNGIWYSRCTDATLVTWSAAALLLQVNGSGNAAAGANEQEPKIVWDSTRGKYLLFTQDGLTMAMRMRISSGSNPVGSYGAATACSLPIPTGDTMWHMDIISESNGRFVMVFCDNHTISAATKRQAWLASSVDGVNWKVAPRPFMSSNSWATAGIYRPSIQAARSGTGYDVIAARHQTPDARLGLVRNIPATEIP